MFKIPNESFTVHISISCSSHLSYMTSNIHYELKFKYIQNFLKLLLAPSLTSYRKVGIT